MRRMGVLAMALVLAMAATNGAMAQRRQREEDDDKLPPSVPPAISTLAPTRGITGPRLEPGAVICRSEFDLQRHAEVNRRRVDDATDPGNPLENCRILNQERAADIVDRHGMGRTEVKLKPSGELGWTDAYVR